MATKMIKNEQHKRFVETARALKCDESEERFDAALRKVAAHKPSQGEDQKGKKEKGKR
jgi:hypothetical protein